MIRIRPYHWERRRAWRTTIGWLISAAIPLAVAVVVAMTGEVKILHTKGERWTRL